MDAVTQKRVAYAYCQIASNRDPFFASNVDPLGVSWLIVRR